MLSLFILVDIRYNPYIHTLYLDINYQNIVYLQTESRRDKHCNRAFSPSLQFFVHCGPMALSILACHAVDFLDEIWRWHVAHQRSNHNEHGSISSGNSVGTVNRQWKLWSNGPTQILMHNEQLGFQVQRVPHAPCCHDNLVLVSTVNQHATNMIVTITLEQRSSGPSSLCCVEIGERIAVNWGQSISGWIKVGHESTNQERHGWGQFDQTMTWCWIGQVRTKLWKRIQTYEFCGHQCHSIVLLQRTVKVGHSACDPEFLWSSSIRVPDDTGTRLARIHHVDQGLVVSKGMTWRADSASLPFKPSTNKGSGIFNQPPWCWGYPSRKQYLCVNRWWWWEVNQFRGWIVLWLWLTVDSKSSSDKDLCNCNVTMLCRHKTFATWKSY